MVRKLIRAGMWGLRGGLLLVSLAALLAWPWSYGHPGRIDGYRWIVMAQRVYRIGVSAGQGLGRLGFDYSYDCNDAVTRNYRQFESEEPTAPVQWFWTSYPDIQGWEALEVDEKLGPVRWGVVDEHRGYSWRRITLPAWVLGLLGVWPVWSVGGLIRRSRRVLRRRRTGCCLQCGYDLRAASDDPAARCPECGSMRQPTAKFLAPAPG